MSTNAMSSANQGPEKFSSCSHVRKFFRTLIHRANARERVKPQDSPAALRRIPPLYKALYARPTAYVIQEENG